MTEPSRIVITSPVTLTTGPGWLHVAWGTGPDDSADSASPLVAPAPTPVFPGPYWVSLVLPSSPTEPQAALRSDCVALDWSAHDAKFRAYRAGENDLQTFGLAPVVEGVPLPAVVIQAQPKGNATKGWPIASVTGPVQIIQEITDALDELRKL